MSGSGSGGYEPPQKTNFDCDTGQIITNVSSIDLTVLDKHNIGSVLEVEISHNHSLTLVDGNGEVLGSILHINTSDIIDCINNGHEYEAEIRNINVPLCTVLIKRK